MPIFKKPLPDLGTSQSKNREPVLICVIMQVTSNS